MITLGKRRIGVRALIPQQATLEQLFFQLTEQDGARAAVAPRPTRSSRRWRDADLLTAYRWELRKLVSQKRTYLGLGAVVAVPLIFVTALALQNGSPNDVAFGRYVRESGLAIPLVLLLFVVGVALPARHGARRRRHHRRGGSQRHPEDDPHALARPRPDLRGEAARGGHIRGARPGR